MLKLGELGPAVIPQVGDTDTVHACLALAASPVSQGAKPQASLAAFKAWLDAAALQANGVNVNHQLVGSNATAYFNLTDPQAHDLVYRHWLVLDWAAQIQGTPYRNGLFAEVFWFVDSGSCRANACIAPQVFG